MEEEEQNEEAVQDAGSAPARPPGRGLATAIRSVTWAYLAALGLICAAMIHFGERTPLTGSLLFLPPQIWIAPGLILLPLCAWKCRWTWLVLCGSAVWFLLGFMAIRRNQPLSPTGASLRVVSFNRGMSEIRALRPVVESALPDVIVLQEANGYETAYRNAFPDYAVRAADEMLLLSKLPVRKANVVELRSRNRGQPYAARFEIDHDGRRIAIYSVHLPTPRDALAAALTNPLLLLPAGDDGTLHARLHNELVLDWQNRLTVARELKVLLKSEPLPHLVVGDFNAPPAGWVYKTMAKGFTDAHVARGNGYGFTFPGRTRWWLEPLAPWVRIDHAFASKDWIVEEATTGPGRFAQHIPIAIRVRLRDTP